MLLEQDFGSDCHQTINDNIVCGRIVTLSRGCKGVLPDHYRVENVEGKRIKRSELMEGKQLRAYYVRRVVSPFEFYLEPESNRGYLDNEDKHLHKRMQSYYNELERLHIQFDIKIRKNLCYAYSDPDPGKQEWWRVRIHNMDFVGHGKERAYVYFCDIGKHAFVMAENLRELTSEFAEKNINVVKCYLYDVLPASGDLHWSTDAIVFFQELLAPSHSQHRRRLGAVVMKQSTTPVAEYSADHHTICGIILTEKVVHQKGPNAFNWLMIKFGFARSIGFMSGSFYMLDRPGAVPSFTTVVPDPEPEQTEPYERKPISLERLREVSNRFCNNINPDSRHVSIYCDQTFVESEPSEHYLPFEIRARLAWMTMSYVFGPGKIYIRLSKRNSELRNLEKAIRLDCRLIPRPSDVKAGDFITCDMQDMDEHWARGLVLSKTLGKNYAKVLLLDYGNVLLFPMSLIYQLPKEYRYVPSFAVRVHLTCVYPTSGMTSWDIEIDDVFKRYVLSHEPGEPIYFVDFRGSSSVVEFTDINQNVVFNDITNKWVADLADVDSLIENVEINSLREDPLVGVHFKSYGVQIMYEADGTASMFWNFNKLSEFLVLKDYASYNTSDEVDKDELHHIIRKGFGRLGALKL